MFQGDIRYSFSKVPVKTAGFVDDEYIKAGAKIETDRKKIFDGSEMIIKVKEPLPEEYALVSRRTDPVYISPPGSRPHTY